jgi:hypothetical protein
VQSQIALKLHVAIEIKQPSVSPVADAARMSAFSSTTVEFSTYQISGIGHDCPELTVTAAFKSS